MKSSSRYATIRFSAIFLLVSLGLCSFTGQVRVQAALITSPSAILNPTILNIDTGSTGLPGTSGLAPIPGVTFVQTASALANGPYDVSGFPINLGGGRSTFLGHQYLSNVSGAAGYSSDEIDFATPVSAVGGYLQQVGSGTAYASSVTLLAYNGDTLVDGPYTISGLPNFLSTNPVFYGISSAQGITRIVWEPGNGTMTAQGGFTGGFIGIGQITVGSSVTVPEPSSTALLGFGLSTLSIWHLRKLRKHA